MQEGGGETRERERERERKKKKGKLDKRNRTFGLIGFCGFASSVTIELFAKDGLLGRRSADSREP